MFVIAILLLFYMFFPILTPEYCHVPVVKNFHCQILFVVVSIIVPSGGANSVWNPTRLTMSMNCAGMH